MAFCLVLNNGRSVIRKGRIDLFGAVVLVLFSMSLGLNQVLIKLVNGGLHPVFQAGIRSAIALIVVLLVMRWRSVRLVFDDGSLWPGILCGTVFAIEFVFLFIALDHTSVGRASVIFYSMPVWLALAAHFLIAGEKMTMRRGIGLVLAVAGVGLAMSGKTVGQASLLGDVLALIAAMLWAVIVLIVRTTSLGKSKPEQQLLYQLVVSAALLLPLSYFAGDWLRDLQVWHLGLLAFQAIGIVGIGFLVWFWILSIYPASDMASFSFLSPVFGVLAGWVILDEAVGVSIIGALALVSVGIVLINYRQKTPKAAPTDLSEG